MVFPLPLYFITIMPGSDQTEMGYDGRKWAPLSDPVMAHMGGQQNIVGLAPFQFRLCAG